MSDTKLSYSPQPHASCERCFRAVEFEVMVTDDVWAKIGPHGDETGYLCFWCMDAACVERGMGCVPCIINVAGRALSSGGAAGHVEVALSLAHRTIERQAREIANLERANNDQRGGGSSEGDGKASASVKQTAEEERPPIATARDAEPAAAPSFSVGDRVEYVGASHEWRGRRGSVVRAEIGRFTWVQFDDNKHLGSTACFSTGLRLLPPATTGGGK